LKEYRPVGKHVFTAGVNTHLSKQKLRKEKWMTWRRPDGVKKVCPDRERFLKKIHWPSSLLKLARSVLGALLKKGGKRYRSSN